MVGPFGAGGCVWGACGTYVVVRFCFDVYFNFQQQFEVQSKTYPLLSLLLLLWLLRKRHGGCVHLHQRCIDYVSVHYVRCGKVVVKVILHLHLSGGIAHLCEIMRTRRKRERKETRTCCCICRC